MSAPIMSDSRGNISTDISLSVVSNDNEKLVIEISASAELDFSRNKQYNYSYDTSGNIRAAAEYEMVSIVNFCLGRWEVFLNANL